MEDAVRIFEMLGCNKSAEYYRKLLILEYLQIKKNDLKFEAIELLGSLVSLEKFYCFFFSFYLLHIFKSFSSKISKCYTIVILT